MPRRPVCLLVLALAIAGCGGSSEAKAPGATVAPPDTTERTTTTAKTLTPEDEVEAAYLKSWDVYAKATLEWDGSNLDRVYTGVALEGAQRDIESLKAANQRARYRVDHDYTIKIDGEIASVLDRYMNHSVALDAATREPVEPDPNKKKAQLYLLRRIEGTWKVFEIRNA